MNLGKRLGIHLQESNTLKPRGGYSKHAQRLPGSRARNHDLSVHDLHREADQVTSRDAVQAIAYLLSLFGRVAVTVGTGLDVHSDPTFWAR